MFAAVLVWSGAAEAATPTVAGDVALAYGRNLGQRLMVAALVGEVKVHVHPQLAVGVRAAPSVGAGVSASSSSAAAKGYLGCPLLLKAEGFASEGSTRPFLGLGLGVTPTSAAGAYADATSAVAWGVQGPLPTLMPELGVDLQKLRLAVQYNVMIGSANAVAASVSEAGVAVSGDTPGLNGLMFQIGGHFGGPG